MAIPEHKMRTVGEATINLEGDIKLPDDVLREVAWKQGDRVRVTIVDGEQIVLTKRPPTNTIERFAGALTDLYPDPEDTRRFLDDARGYNDESDPLTEP
jgi:bifunctional DNA-binding transcriptional regulator/antitoxin component of YhaV-PrlF toxin-antitoxin module